MTKSLAWAAAAACLLAGLPLATAHGAPPVRSVDVRLLLDDDGAVAYGGCVQGTCQPAVPPSGLDLLALDAREAYLDDGAPAVVLRLSVQSETPQPGASLVVHLTSGGKARDLTATTADGLAYTGSGMDRLDGPFDVGDGHPKALDVWMRDSTLGAKPGDAITAISVDSGRGATKDDTMPGGWFEQGAEVPSLPTDPSQAADKPSSANYTLHGPPALVGVSLSASSLDLAKGPATVQVTLRNNTTLPQFTTIVLAAPEGMSARLAQGGLNLDPSATRTVDLKVANASADGTVHLTVVSDLGARATLDLAVKAARAPSTTAASSSTSPPAKSSPAPMGALLALALFAAAARRRA